MNSVSGGARPLADALNAVSNPVVEIEDKFGLHLPPWLVLPLTLLAVLVAFMAAFGPLAPVGRWLLTLARGRLRRPNADERHLWRERRMFASYVCSDLALKNSREDWRDERFTDLEAEVEVEGRVRRRLLIRRSSTRTVQLRRERSLAKALERSEEPIIILEGEPGAGKSVALRHLALTLASRAAKAAQPGVIPLYVNLRSFRPQRPVTPEHVNDFIFATLAEVKDRNVVAFLEQEYQAGLREGRWLILLDSFDEIPDVLSATDADETVREYAEAIYQFVHAMKSCRSIVASREFRGPGLRLPRFRIMPMRPAHQRALVRICGIKPAQQDEVLGAVMAADSEWGQMAANPMFLSMLCAYARDFETMPETRHAVFEQYFTARLAADADRIGARFGVDVDTVRAVAELAAYLMAARGALGLEPERTALIDAVAAVDGNSERAVVGRVLDALEFTKLARSSPGGAMSGVTFSFAHRRFQEYFATCQVLRAPESVSRSMLLFDGQWRETAVTMLQTRSADELAPLLDAAATWLGTVLDVFEDDGQAGSLHWPAGALHLLGILANGASEVPGERARLVRVLAGRLLARAWAGGRGHDRVWALEVILAADPDTVRTILEAAMAQRSTLVQEGAYRAAGRLADPPEAVKAGIRSALIALAVDGRLYTQREQVRARVGRLRSDKRAANTLSVLRVIPALAVALAVLTPLALTAATPRYWPVTVTVAAVGALLEYSNIAVVLHLKPRETRPIDLLATRPLSALAPAPRVPLLALIARVVVVILLLVVDSILVKSNAAAAVATVAIMALVAPMFLMMMAVHPLEHGCAGPVRALTVGMPLGVYHLPLHRLGPALRELTTRARAAKGSSVRLSGSSVRSAAKEIGPSLLVVFALLGTGPCLYRYQSHRGAYIYAAVLAACLASLYTLASIPAIGKWRAARERVRAVRVHGNAFALGELKAVLGAVQSKWEMTATLRAIASCDALPASDAVEFLADFALLADRELLERGLSLHAEMYAWLSGAPQDLARLAQLITHDGTDEIIRMADACERQGNFRPLSHQGVAPPP